MKAILNEVGITSILVTHDQEEAFDIADQVAVFNRCCLPSVQLASSLISTATSSLKLRDS